MAVDKKHYIYEGRIKSFDDVIETNWHGETYAETEARAKSNLAFKYKYDHDIHINTKISLPDEIRLK